MTGLRRNLLFGAAWSAAGQVVYLFISLITNVWLARLLSPKEFGQIGIIMFFITIANVLGEGGMVGALVRKKEPTRDDYSTVFIFNFTVNLILYGLLALLTPYIAGFYNDPELKNLIWLSGLVLLINAFQITQQAKLISEHRFKQLSIFRIVAIFISSIIGISIAYAGGKAMALVVVQVLNALILTIELWYFKGVFFSLKFSRDAFRELFKFGINTTLSSILTTAFDNIYQLILGKYFAIREVGYYYQAKRLQDIPGGIINMVAQNVVFSSLSKLQDNKQAFISAFEKIFSLFSVFLMFLTCIVYMYSKEIIFYLFGQQWMGSVPLMQLLALATIFSQIELVNRLIFKVFNKTDKILYLEILKKLIQMISIVVGIYFLDIGILLKGFIISNIISYFLNHSYSRRILELNMWFGIGNIIKIVSFSIVIVSLFIYIKGYFATGLLWTIFHLFAFSIIYFVGLMLIGVFDLFDLLSKLFEFRKNALQNNA